MGQYKNNALLTCYCLQKSSNLAKLTAQGWIYCIDRQVCFEIIMNKTYPRIFRMGLKLYDAMSTDVVQHLSVFKYIQCSD